MRFEAYNEFMGNWTLHVKAIGDDVEVLDYVRVPGLQAPEGGVGSHNQMPTDAEGIKYVKEQLKHITVEGQFQSISDVFSSGWSDLYTVNVLFDSDSGSLRHVSRIPGPNGTEPSSWSVTSFRILKQGMKIVSAP